MKPNLLPLVACLLLLLPGCSAPSDLDEQAQLLTDDGAARLALSPGQHVSWSLDDTPLDRTAAQVKASTADHLARATALREEVMAVQVPRNVDNTLEPLNRMYMHIEASSMENDLLASVHPEKAVRDAADQGGQAISRYVTELNLDRDLYDAILVVDVSSEDPATQYAIEKDLRGYRRAGVDQPENVRKRIARLNEELTELSQDFSRNIAEDVREITLDSVDQLAGLPADYIEAHKPGKNGKITINTTYPDYQPFMKYAQDGEARRRLYLQYTNRAHPKNLKVLDAIIAKRDEKAELLGYDNWAEYITEDKMIGSAGNAADFINMIAEAAAGPAEADYELLLERKRQDVPSAMSVKDWEKVYYGNLVEMEQFDFDPQEVRPYFNYEDVQQGIFDVSSRLFGVEFQAVPGLDLWHENVTAWDLLDDGELIGRFYLDMFPRENKYGHAACFPYRSGIAGERLPQATLVCNFPNPRTSPDGVALMEFGQVETFFHEFGHLLHHLFAGNGRWTTNAGISNEWDFVEAPSQMLEEFLLDTETLQSFARNYQTGQPIPEELIDKARAASDFGKGMNTAHQMFYAALSLNCYTRHPDTLDTTALVQEMQARYSPFRYVDGAHFQCSFGHLDGYSAIYYTYMWSQVIAKDMFSRFEAEGVLNPDTARRYRESVLAPGSQRPAAELVAEFLGREYSFETFESWLNSN